METITVYLRDQRKPLTRRYKLREGVTEQDVAKAVNEALHKIGCVELVAGNGANLDNFMPCPVCGAGMRRGCFCTMCGAALEDQTRRDAEKY